MENDQQNDPGKIFDYNARLKLHGDEGIRVLGHREYVGGLWDEIGKLQFDYVVAQGLKPEHYFLDIACGSLRGGIHFIHYLEAGHYLGIDREPELIKLGIEKELGQEVFEAKHPEFVISSTFEFELFSQRPDFSIAQSLFTHLTIEDICLCLEKLRSVVSPGHTLFATFFEGISSANPDASHSQACFFYSSEKMASMGRLRDWEPTYIGFWNHPRNQMMMKYVAK